MTREVQGLIVMVIGFVALRLTLTGAYLSYVKEGMRYPLLGTGAVLAVLGAVTLFRTPASPATATATSPEHDHGDHGAHGAHGPGVAWLLLLPLLAIILVAPAPLGAYAAARDTNRAPATVSAFPPLPPVGDGPLAMSLTEFMQRSYYDDANSLAGVTVLLSGFVVADPGLADGYQLTRFALSCCAADAFALQIEARGAPDPVPPDDTWVEVVGTWVEPPDNASGVQRGAALQISTQTVIDQPENPYE